MLLLLSNAEDGATKGGRFALVLVEGGEVELSVVDDTTTATFGRGDDADDDETTDVVLEELDIALLDVVELAGALDDDAGSGVGDVEGCESDTTTLDDVDGVLEGTKGLLFDVNSGCLLLDVDDANWTRTGLSLVLDGVG